MTGDWPTTTELDRMAILGGLVYAGVGISIHLARKWPDVTLRDSFLVILMGTLGVTLAYLSFTLAFRLVVIKLKKIENVPEQGGIGQVVETPDEDPRGTERDTR